MKKYLLTALLYSCFLSSLFAQNVTKPGTLADLQFMVGHWQGTYQTGIIEGTWTEPNGDSMMGMVRIMNEGSLMFYLIFTAEQTEKGPVLMFKYFNSGLVGFEEKDAPHLFTFLEASKDRMVFVKPGTSKHVSDPPRMMIERRQGNKLVIALGSPRGKAWQYMDLFTFSAK